MTKNRFVSKSQLIQFIVQTIDLYRDTPDITNGALIKVIIDRVDMAYRPFNDWINNDGELDSIIEIIEMVLS